MHRRTKDRPRKTAMKQIATWLLICGGGTALAILITAIAAVAAS